MMVERIAAGPEDHADVGIARAMAVELVFAAGLAQHVGDARDRNAEPRRIERRRKLRPRQIGARIADAVGRAVAEGEAAARKPDAAEHGGERDRRPIRLLAVMRALQRPGAGDHAAHRRRAAREVANGLRRNAADRLRPFRRFRRAVVAAEHDSARTPRSRCNSAPGIRDRGGRPRSACAPSPSIIAVSVFGLIGIHCAPRKSGTSDAVRRHDDEFDAGVLGALEPHLQHMRAGAARGDLRILEREPAEGDHQPRVLDDRSPVGDVAPTPAQTCR